RSGRTPGFDEAAFERLLRPGPEAELRHFIGKDIVNFHGLFWPAVLGGNGLRLPDRLHVNGYLMVDGAKMSKSRGTFVMARTYLDRSEERRVGKEGGARWGRRGEGRGEWELHGM